MTNLYKKYGENDILIGIQLDVPKRIQNNCLYEILTIGIQEGKITDDFPKQLIQIFKPQFLEETRYLTMTVDVHGCTFFYDFLTDSLSSPNNFN